MDELAYSLIILNLFDKVLRQVNGMNTGMNTAAKVWSKLESLYMIKSLTNKIHLKRRLFSFKMDSSKSLQENLDDFNVIIIGLANIDEVISDENQAIILLNFVPESYRDLRIAIEYGRTSLTLEDVLSALRSDQETLKLRVNKNLV